MMPAMASPAPGISRRRSSLMIPSSGRVSASRLSAARDRTWRGRDCRPARPRVTRIREAMRRPARHRASWRSCRLAVRLESRNSDNDPGEYQGIFCRRSPPAEKATARRNQTGQASTGDGVGDGRLNLDSSFDLGPARVPGGLCRVGRTRVRRHGRRRGLASFGRHFLSYPIVG
jgi:hypothetical protein